METFARALDRAMAAAIVPRARIDRLRSAFIATDTEGGSWTIDPEFQRWGRLDGERWIVDDPPPRLFMDSELRAALEALEAMAARAIVRGADALRAPRTPWFRTPVAPAEPSGMPASIPSLESATRVASATSPEVFGHEEPMVASHEYARWVPTSIAPRLMSERFEARDDHAHVFLCGLLAALFLALALWKGDGRGYAAALLFGLLAVTLLVLNLPQSRHD